MFKKIKEFFRADDWNSPLHHSIFTRSQPLDNAFIDIKKKMQEIADEIAGM